LFISRLQGNPLCSNTNLDTNLVQLCVSGSEVRNNSQGQTNVALTCAGCPPPYEHSPVSPQNCLCAAPLLVGYRLKSPGFSDFLPYVDDFEWHLADHLKISSYQLYLHSFAWESGPRLRMFLKIFPAYNSNSFTFNQSEVRRIMDMFTTHGIHDHDLFGPCEVMNFTLSSVYIDGLSRNLI
jgi:hypothetical protein